MHKLYTLLLALGALCCSPELRAQVVVSELNYNPDSTVSAGDWIELLNASASAVDISGWRLVDGNLTHFPFVVPNGTSLAPGARIVMAANLAKFDLRHPGVPRLGPLGFEFSNSGEMITLSDNANQVRIQFMYDDSLPWNRCADGFGRTLELLDPAVSPADPANWRCGCINGSPGAPFTPCTDETLLVSEINYNSPVAEEAGDWIELWNNTNGSLNLSGYKFRDTRHVYVFPAGTALNPQERLVVYNDAVNFSLRHPGVTKKIGPFGFGLGGDGDAVRIYNASDRLIQSLWYDDDGPWPKCAYGEGATLELALDFNLAKDISAASSWFCGCPAGSPGTPFVNSCGVGVSEPAKAEMGIWPNPARDRLYIETNEGISRLRIVSMDGKTRYDRTHAGTLHTVDVSPLPAGMYVVAVTRDGHTAYAKWIRE